MRHVILRGLRVRAKRFIGTFLAVFLGVSFLSGTIVLGDTLESNFESLFAEANANTDVVVRTATDVTTEDIVADAPIDAAVLDVVRSVDGVANAVANVQGYGQLVGSDGDLIGGNGPPTFAGNWIDDPALNPYELGEGRAPRADDEVVINRGAAKTGDLHIGDVVEVRVPQPVQVRIVGLATFGGEDGLGPTTFTAFTLEAAQRYLVGGPDHITSVQVRASDGVDQDELAARVSDQLPDGLEAITGAALTDENVSDINSDFLGAMRTVLVVFSAIAMLVATFSIHNTFAIVVAQRTHESALLRALGATRGQVLSSVLLESLAVGVVTSAAGVLGGLGIATLLKVLFDAAGFGALPTGGLTVQGAAIAIAFGVGVVATVVAGLSPALRAGRIAPLAAMREVAAERVDAGRVRAIVGPSIAAVGVAVVVVNAAGSGSIGIAGIGALLTLVGFVACGPLAARPVTLAVGAPVTALRGVTGALARENALRSPRRTARTASALMIGVGVVTLFTVFAASMRASIERAVDDSVTGELVVSAGTFGGSGFSPDLATSIADDPAVDAAAGLGMASVRIDGDATPLTVVEPEVLGRIADLDVTGGDLAALTDRDLAVSDDVADDNGWEVGSTIDVLFPDGSTQPFTVAATYDRTTLVGNYVMSRAAWAPHAVQDMDRTVLIGLRDGVSVADGRHAVERVAAAFGNPDVLTRAEFVDDMTRGVDMALAVVYVMLALAIIIAAMGIANTLSLSIHERRRELGLLRAVGQDRSQTRSMVRWEAVIVAVFGTVGGLVLGTFLGWGLLQGLANTDSTPLTEFAIPFSSLAIVLVVGAIAGVLAALRPARRAARLDVLTAVAAP